MGSQGWFRCLIGLFALVAFLALPGAAALAPRASVGKDLKQCKNGRTGTGSCITVAHGNEPGWDNGTINQNNGLYRMGDFVPFRAELTGLQAGQTYTLRMGFRAVHNGLHSYDYLGTYDARSLATEVVPCGGITIPTGPHACGTGPTPGAPSIRPIPEDARTTFPDGSHPPRNGHVSAWGATLSDVAQHVCAHCGVIGPNTGGTVHRQFDITFTAHGSTVLLAWGGHVARARDWGFGRTYAEAGSGAAGFQMYLQQVHQQGGGNFSTGTVARDMNVNATGRPSAFSTEATFTPNPPPTVLVGQEVTDRATLTAATGSPPKPVSGRVRFFVCGPPPLPDLPTTGGCPSPTGRDLDTSEVQRLGTANGFAEITFHPEVAGRYCFRAEFEPDPMGYYSQRAHTDGTNECFTAVEARIRLTKLCDPTDDRGLFNLLFNNTLLGAPNVACGESRPPAGTPYFDTTAGTHTVGEAAGTGTSLTDYETTFGGNCAGGSITLGVGETRTCEITNTRVTPPPPPPPPPPASLTLRKVCVPTTDPGVFELRVDEAPVADLRCGESTAAPVGVAPVTHTVSEAGVPPTNLADYTTVISGDCAASGSITLAPGQPATCIITNTRRPVTPTATLRVDKVCLPAGDRGRFNLTINGQVVGTGANVGCRGTTGPVQVAPGTHTVRETAAGGTHLSRYRVVIGGDCAADGTVTIAAGQHLTCLITNVASVPGPPPFCPELAVGRRMVSTGSSVRVLARVHLGGRPVQGIQVFAVGPGVSASRLTGRTGRALFVLNLRRPGILVLSIRRAFECPKPVPHKIGVLGATQTFLTG